MITDKETQQFKLELGPPDTIESAAVGNIDSEWAFKDAGKLYDALKFARMYNAAVDEGLKREGDLLSRTSENIWKQQGHLNGMLSEVAVRVPVADRKAIDAFYDGPPAATPSVPRRGVKLHQKIARLVRQADSVDPLAKDGVHFS